MSLIVQKFGGSSVSNSDRINKVAKIITDIYAMGNDIVVVVSAQGQTTDNLIETAKKTNKHPSKREMDVLLSTGEQMTIALLAMAVENLGYPVISLTGWQAGFKTSANHENAKIQELIPKRILEEMKKKKIVIVAGFQGIDEFDDITTLGRGGSDASAVKIASVLKANVCKIYTDVDGVYTADPRIVKNAKKLEKINFSEMIYMSFLGAQVINVRAAQIAKEHNAPFEVLSSFSDNKGTIVEGFEHKKTNYSGISLDNNSIKITLKNLSTRLILKSNLIESLLERDIRPDMIRQKDITKVFCNITLVVDKNFLDVAMEVIKKITAQSDTSEFLIDNTFGKISLVGTGLDKDRFIFDRVLKVFEKQKIKICSFEINMHRISLLLKKEFLNLGAIELHKEFFEKQENI
ncbi:aspartokinase [Clostridia bacterium]|nr:aspartokinase [Clostridia bacterium]